MNAPSDQELVIRVRRGAVNDYGELVRRYQVSVFNVCYRLVGERREAEDMTQEAFIRAFERLGTFDASRPFGPWIRQVAANHCLNRLKIKHHSAMELDVEFDWPEATLQASLASPLPTNPETALEKKERSYAIREALFALPDHYRAVIELRHFQELDYEEMAKRLNLPINTVKSHLFRARKLLADRLKHV